MTARCSGAHCAGYLVQARNYGEPWRTVANGRYASLTEAQRRVCLLSAETVERGFTSRHVPAYNEIRVVHRGRVVFEPQGA